MADLWLTIDEVADLAYAAEFRGEALAIAIAVTKPEAGLGAPEGKWSNATALGDLTLVDATYGPSVGLWQVRSVNAERGKGTTRDAVALASSPAHQARAAYSIAGGNTTTGSSHPNKGWGHWSTWKNGAFRGYLDDARAAAMRREAIGGTGSIAGGGAPTRPDVSDDIAVGGSGRTSPTFPPGYKNPRTVDDLVLVGAGGRVGERRIGELVTAGTVELTLREASQLSLTLNDTGFQVLGLDFAINKLGELRGELRWGPHFRFMIAANEQAPGPGPDDPHAVLTAREYGVERLKLTNVGPGGQVFGDKPVGFDASGKNISPTEYAAMQAGRYGLFFVGQGSERRTDIAPVKDERGIYESPWEVLHRLGKELGFLVYVVDDTLYFGRPTWLANRATGFKVGYHGSWGDLSVDTADLPRRRESIDTFDGATITFKLPRWRGELVRPGMVAEVKLHPAVETTRWLVEAVSWDVDGGEGDVTVDAVEPVDPPVKAVQGAGQGGTAVTSSAPAGPFDPNNGNLDPDGDGKTPRIGDDERQALFGPRGDHARYGTWETPWGINVEVHELVMPFFQVAAFRAYDTSAWVPHRIDSVNVRPIAGTSSWSLHSYALAWDFFDTPPGVPPPGGVRGALNAPDELFRRAFASAGFYLGAVFSNPDYPHIEWANVPPVARG